LAPRRPIRIAATLIVLSLCTIARAESLQFETSGIVTDETG